MAKHNYKSTIPTYQFHSHLDQLEKKCMSEIRECRDFNQHLNLVGRLKLIEELHNLPETLQLMEESDDANS